jgi:hypothetical protein
MPRVGFEPTIQMSERPMFTSPKVYIIHITHHFRHTQPKKILLCVTEVVCLHYVYSNLHNGTLEYNIYQRNVETMARNNLSKLIGFARRLSFGWGPVMTWFIDLH